MAQVVQPLRSNACALEHRPPLSVEVHERPVGLSARKNPGAVFQAWLGQNDIERSRGQCDDLRASLAVGQDEATPFNVQPRPLRLKNLATPRTRHHHNFHTPGKERVERALR